ncbi:hypothetical protein BDBG_01454 [Blastomyces gilchristii SLH14081]|uniref:Uncharacterized protein n=1 Tax=Blastomyces gilchristii (strain SLH14081) TaxID=559298 RepID=A0A179UBA2_BLAGS|nr:uncharacterized protein BDBG_01454 [Blastomyces gilchristii SLH14081]OAT04993.1 hypothetical protein BDBG_01454 [Blastomyces gilchristii SLH14081]
MESSSSEEQALISALEVLLSASSERLLQLRARVQKTIGQISRQLASVQSPSSVAFLDSLLECSHNITTYLDKPASEQMRQTWTIEDPRITDMRKGKRATSQEKYLHFFAERSLALEKEAWERHETGSAQVDNLMRDLNSASEDHNGTIKQFLHYKGFKDTKFIYEGVKRGEKIVVNERLYPTRRGLTTVAAFQPALFRRISYEIEQMNKIIELLRNGPQNGLSSHTLIETMPLIGSGLPSENGTQEPSGINATEELSEDNIQGADSISIGSESPNSSAGSNNNGQATVSEAVAYPAVMGGLPMLATVASTFGNSDEDIQTGIDLAQVGNSGNTDLNQQTAPPVQDDLCISDPHMVPTTPFFDVATNSHMVPTTPFFNVATNSHMVPTAPFFDTVYDTGTSHPDMASNLHVIHASNETSHF